MHWLVNPDDPLPTLEQVEQARAAVGHLTLRTPLLRVPVGATDPPMREVYLKPELLQPAGSFKLRGVANAVQQVAHEGVYGTVSVVSSGNAAQAVAWAARHFGLRARAIMPETTPANKVERFIALGGVPDLRPAADCWNILNERLFVDDPDAFIHPTADARVIAGYGAIALEILEDLPDVRTIYVPVGGGGLISGIANIVMRQAPQVQVIGVQPGSCTPIIDALTAGRIVESPCDTICDGVAGTTTDPDTWPLLNAVPLGWTTATDEQTLAAMRLLALRNRLTAEPSGALAVAGALAHTDAPDGPAVCIVSGGSVDPRLLAQVLLGTSASFLQ